MEAHPVPQNIIDVEFKLFGSFTLKQFGKMLVGCLLALALFVSGLPDLIKFPLCFISIILGIGMAIIPSLGTWLNGFTRAIFFSPRYVWVKDTFTPDILQNRIKAKPGKDSKVSSALNKKIEITDLPLDKLFGTKSATSIKSNNNSDDTTDDKNFGRVYQDVFGKDILQRDENSSLNQLMQSNTKTKSNVSTQLQDASIYNKINQSIVPSTEKIIVPIPQRRRFKTIDEYNQEIQKLKFQLSMLSKDNEYKDREEQILSQINDLYIEVKALSSMSQPRPEIKTNAALFKNPRISQQALEEGRVIFGIVVDKLDTPIALVNISFINSQTKMIYRTISSRDGKFATSSPLPFGTYTITLEDSKHKFHSYSIEIKNQKLPAYKFREK